MLDRIVTIIMDHGRDPHEYATALTLHCVKTGESVEPARVAVYAAHWLRTGEIR